jgi:tRNA nucleotidyltransferase (CCA-adding enzyme)
MDISKVSKERIEQEFNKLLLQSKRPSLGFRWLESIGRLFEILPELYNTINVKQDPLWHPEGTVFEHLMQSLDSSALLKYSSDQEKLVVMLSALCHDLGKVNTTIWQNGHIKSPGHALAGVSLSKSLLSRITDNKKLIKTVSVLVKCHMRPGQLINSVAKLNAYKRLALDLNNESKGNANIDMLLKLAIADQQGRNPNSHQPLNERVKWIDKFKEKVKEANIFYEPEKSILKGSDILDLINPGPEMGKILKFAYDIQLNKNIKDKDLLKKIIIEEFNLKSKS